MGAPLGITLVNLADLPSIVTSPSYTEILHDTLGVSGTDADGTPSAIADLFDHLNAFESDVLFGGNDVADIIGAASTFDPSAANQLAADLPGIKAAGDKLLGEVDSLTGPPPPPPPPQAAPSQNKQIVLVGMNLGAPPATVDVGGDQWGRQEQQTVFIRLVSGDPVVFQLKDVRTDKPIMGGEPLHFVQYNLIVTPSKVGTFTATIEERDVLLNNTVITDSDYIVTIAARHF